MSKVFELRLLILGGLAATLTGCIAQTAVDIVTLPVKAASKSVDLLTTSQSEADETRGRATRKQEECIGKERRRAQSEERDPDLSRCQED